MKVRSSNTTIAVMMSYFFTLYGPEFDQFSKNSSF